MVQFLWKISLHYSLSISPPPSFLPPVLLAYRVCAHLSDKCAAIWVWTRWQKGDFHLKRPPWLDKGQTGAIKVKKSVMTWGFMGYLNRQTCSSGCYLNSFYSICPWIYVFIYFIQSSCVGNLLNQIKWRCPKITSSFDRKHGFIYIYVSWWSKIKDSVSLEHLTSVFFLALVIVTPVPHAPCV